MPRLVPISDPETPALLALRRTLWQLAFVGIATATTLVQMAPEFHLLASWCVLLPLVALAVHFRHALFDAVLAHGPAHAAPVNASRNQRPQARRARSNSGSASRRQARLRNAVPARIGPHAC